MSDTLNVLCAGAVQGIVKALQETYSGDTGAKVDATFGAVGAMKEALLAGEPCDVMIVTDAMVMALGATGNLRSETRMPIGRVRTGIAVRSGQAPPDIGTPDTLKAALLAAGAIYFPDPKRATAGIHFASVIERLGIREAVAARVRNFPNGATSMRELAADRLPGSIGCTQITEIMYTPGIDLVGALPDVFELSTVYAAAQATNCEQPLLARRFIDLLTGNSTRPLRMRSGFEFD